MRSGLPFREVIDLVNRTRVTVIEPEPLRQSSGWALYRGYYRVHIEKTYFHVIYLNSYAQASDLLEAEREAFEGSMHVVYAPSLAAKETLKRLFAGKAKGLWTTDEYLYSFLRDELDHYRSALAAYAPEYYVDPQVEQPSGDVSGDGNPLLDALLQPAADDLDGGVFVLLAEPGQGKTYMSRHLAATISRTKSHIVPVLIESVQWLELRPDDLRSLWRTILHSFAHFGVPIVWADGHEEQFLKTTLKADIVRLIFDGLDEYVLRNRGNVTGLSALDALSDLARETGAQIVVTARTSFWENIAAPPSASEGNYSPYRILPFEPSYARKYFEKRGLRDESLTSAVELFGGLSLTNREYAGRGYVLFLIADLCQQPNARQLLSRTTKDIDGWLLYELCKREQAHQDLPLDAESQLNVLRTFASEVATGQEPTTETFAFCLDLERQLSIPARRHTLDKFREHPLIDYDVAVDYWSFKQKQTEVTLLAQAILASSNRIASVVSRLQIDGGTRQDLVATLVQRLLVAGYDSASRAVQSMISNLAGVAGGGAPGSHSGDAPRVAGAIAMLFVDRARPMGTPHARGEVLQLIGGGSVIQGLTFGGAVARLDLRHTTFRHCSFEGVSWLSCVFDDTTRFERCVFVGSGEPERCIGIELAHFRDCDVDQELNASIRTVRLALGHRSYALADLESDLRAIVSKFVIKGGLNTKEVKERNLIRGTISVSPHRAAILETMQRLVIARRSAGEPEPVFSVREEARPAIRSFATDNAFVGPLRTAFDELKRALNL